MKSQLCTFSNLSATAFMLFYLLFPTIILMFVYPTQITVIFTFVTAYLFATTIFSAGIGKLYKVYLKEEDQQTKSDCCCYRSLSYCCLNDFKKNVSKACCRCTYRCLDCCRIWKVPNMFEDRNSLHIPVVDHTIFALSCSFCFMFNVNWEGLCHQYRSIVPHFPTPI